MDCHKCLKKIHLWERRVEEYHIECLPIERKYKYYRMQTDIGMSIVIAVIVSTVVICSSAVSIHYVAVFGICAFLFSSVLISGMREMEEREQK